MGTQLQQVRSSLRPGWFLREGTSKAPRGYLALEYGMETTTATRQLVAAIHPDDLDRVRGLYPEAFVSENANRCPVCGGLNPGDITHTRC